MLPSLKKLLRYLWHLIPRSIRSLIIPFINWLHDLAGDEGTFLVNAKRFDEANARLNQATIALGKITALNKTLQPYHAIMPKLQRIENMSDQLRSEVIIAVSAESLPYAIAAKGQTDTPVFCDATEFPALDVRTLIPDWPKSNMKLMNMMYFL